MDCDRTDQLISEDIAGEITPEGVRALADHLTACDACRSLADDYRRQHREIVEAFATRRRSADELSRRIAATFSGAYPSTSPPGVPHPSRRLFPMAAALAVGFVLGWTALATWRSKPPPAEVTGNVAPAVDEGSSARLAYATGPVEVLTEGSSRWRRLLPGHFLPEGARLRCAPESLCELEDPDGSVLRLDRGTEVRLAESRDWELARGRVGARVARNVIPFVVRVADATVTALGTRFDVLRAGERTVVNVFEGATRVRRAEEARVVRRGEEARLADTIRVKRMDGTRLAQASSWVNALLTIEGRDNAEVEERLDELLAGLGQSKMDLLYEREIRALGTSCVIPLLRYIASPRSNSEPRKREQAAEIVADLATDDSINDLIQLLPDENGKVRSAIARGLERITAVDQGLPAEKWATLDWVECEPAYLRWVEWVRSRSNGQR